MEQSTRNTILDKLTTKNVDMHGRRIINAGSSKQSDDYVTRAELDSAISGVTPVSVSNFISQKIDQTAHRVLNTVYRNSLRTPLVVSLTVNLVTLNQVAIYSDGQTTPTLLIANLYAASTGTILFSIPVTFIVLPGEYYLAKKILGAPTITTWIEWS